MADGELGEHDGSLGVAGHRAGEAFEAAGRGGWPNSDRAMSGESA